MRTAAALLPAFLLASAGCTFSSVDPDARVHVTGRALDAQGRPLRDAQVLLMKEADLGEVVFGSVLAVGTLSTICLAPEPPAICDEARTATTGDDGRYEFELQGSETQGTLGTQSTLDVVVADPEGQASTALSFTAQGTEVQLPPVRLWRSKMSLSRQGRDIGLSWSPLPQDAGRELAYAANLFDDSGAAIWSEPGSGGRATLDPRLLEDQPGRVAVTADAALSGGRGVGDLRAHYGSRHLPVRATSGPPPSRGRPCAGVSGPRHARPSAPCAATDGDLATPAKLSTRKGFVTGVVVDLGSTRPVRLVVARGLVGQVVVEVSGDGAAYRSVATTSGPTIAVDVQGRPTARYVRLRSAGLRQGELTEVSIW